MRIVGIMVAAALLGAPVVANAQNADGDARVIKGTVQVTGGDSLRIVTESGKVRIRLFGIDAPEKRQPCESKGRNWDCGSAAAKRLIDLAADRPAVCVQRASDRFRRIYAVCTVDGQDINEVMVRAGMALAVRDQSDDYVAAEEEAKAEGIGVWQGEFMMPWDYREEVTPRG